MKSAFFTHWQTSLAGILSGTATILSSGHTGSNSATNWVGIGLMVIGLLAHDGSKVQTTNATGGGITIK